MFKAVILAAGRGTRMRRAANDVQLDPAQAVVAQSGVKALIPIGGRPFIDYLLSSIVDAGYERVCLVIGPAHDAIRRHVNQFNGGRLQIEFAIQTEPLGTANAVRAAADFAGDDPFLLINSDNYYPQSALRALRALSGAGVAGFRPIGLCRGNIAHERLRSFAILLPAADGKLAQVHEKPASASVDAQQSSRLIGMNCWRFRPPIFDACRAIPRSPRNEYELPDAVNYAIDRLGERFELLPIDDAVLDLSSQFDVADVSERLASIEVRL